MLTFEEFQLGAADNLNDRNVALFQLRNSTTSLLIQCLADREIQKNIDQNDDTRPSGAYHYNCAIIHQPHRASKLVAVSGHGWDPKNQKPLDRNLWLGRVLHSRQIVTDPNSDNSINNLLECLLFQNSTLKKELKNERQKRIACEEDGKQTETIRQLLREKANLEYQLQQKEQLKTTVQAQSNNVVMTEFIRKLQTVNTGAKNELECEKRRRMAAEEALSKGRINQRQIIEQLQREKASLEYQLRQQSQELRVQEKSQCCCIVM